METAFDDLYHTKKEATRQEKIPSVSLLHQVPKQVADTAQAVGVSEKFLENGIPSGVLGPSQIAHDRYLSFIDGIQDAFWAALFIILLPLVEFNLFTGTIVSAMALYWIFHIYWWEKGKVWYIKTSVIRYINATYRIYWITFFLFAISLVGTVDYFIYTTSIEYAVVDIINSILTFIANAEKAFAGMFPQASILNPNANYRLTLIEDVYQPRIFAVSIGFFLLSIGAKILFTMKNKKERALNIVKTDEELEYTGERAMRELHYGFSK